VSGAKTILIVIDGTQKVKKTAEDIAVALKGNKVVLKDASVFAGTDLLPADVVFIGCDEPSPPSFRYLDDLFQHINLAGRPLGIFSSGSDKTIQYLTKMVKDSEVALYPEPFIIKNSGDIKNWITMVLAGRS